MVTFHPTSGGVGARGRTDASGGFTIGTFTLEDGAVPGDYGVTVVKLEPAQSTAVAEGDPGYSPDAVEAAPKHLLPEKYSKIPDSGLTAKIGTDPVSNLEFKLE